MAYILPKPGLIFERDGRCREVVSVHRPRNGMISIEWQRSGAEWRSYGSNVCTWKKWARNAVEVPKDGSAGTEVKD